jgi:sulfur dioxygenase
MHFRQLYTPQTHTFTYLIADLRVRDAVVIDPQPEQDELILALLVERDLHLTRILQTHIHSGESNQSAALCRHTGAELAVGHGTSCSEAQRVVRHGDILDFGDELLRVLATPGHTAGSVSYLWRDRLFCGDALAIRGCSHSDDPSGDPRHMYDSVTQRLFMLADETLIFPGHECDGRSVSSIAEERNHNPYFSGQSRDAFATSVSQLQSTVARTSATKH